MITRTFTLPIIAIVLAVAAPSIAQQTGHEQQRLQAQADTKSPSGGMHGMRDMDKMMQQRMQHMHQQETEMQSNLDRALSKMNAADGEARFQAAVDAINVMAANQRAMDDMHKSMMQMMMGHMAQHMAKTMGDSAMGEMMKCPVMQDMMKDGMMGGGTMRGDRTKGDMMKGRMMMNKDAGASEGSDSKLGADADDTPDQ